MRRGRWVGEREGGGEGRCERWARKRKLGVVGEEGVSEERESGRVNECGERVCEEREVGEEWDGEGSGCGEGG